MKKLLLIFSLIFCFVSVALAQDVQELLKSKEQLWQTVGNVTIRSKPTTESEAVGYLKQGVIVKELEQTAQWVKIESQTGQRGWVSKSLLRTVTAEALKGCQGVTGFSAVCPINKKADPQQAQNVPVQVQGKMPLAPIGALAGANPSGQVSPGKIPQPAVPSEVSEAEVEASQGAVPPPAFVQPQQTGKQPNIEAKGTLPGVLESAPYQAEQISGSAYIVEPERATAVKMSASDVNRLVCPYDVKDVVYSEEKGVQVKVSGKNAFVKFLVKRIGNKEQYSQIPADLYVVCGDKVYSIIAFPERIPSVTVYLEDKEKKVKEVLEKYSSMPFEKRIVEYVKTFFKGNIPPEAEMKPVRKNYTLYEHIGITEVAQYTIPGEDVLIRVFNIKCTGLPEKATSVEIAEKDFLRKELTQMPLAISLEKLRLVKGETVKMLIIERAKEVE
ncbi:TraK domain-containing protein [Thermodesulfovibrio yellowstonii]|uniref:TraK domain-containing protein n=1 Tax=Thermodesulfovibrio yellowstonii TaxID=28262 RepID=UPI00041BD17A|nr:type-F conjugative transfer system secretin TraK [Thermodesulfovibrio islandicus]